MLLTALLSIVIEILAVILTTISALLPEVNLDIIYPYINDFIDIVIKGINGFRFIAGPLPFQLAKTILGFYTTYYFIIIPIKYLIRTIGKGN